MYGEILRTLLNKPVQSERDVRSFAVRVSLICFAIAFTCDGLVQLLAFGSWVDVLRGWAITTIVVLVVAFPIGVYLGSTRLDHYRIKRKLSEQSLNDILTGLRGRASLPLDYDQNLDPGRSVILLAVDRFKAVNERYGHLAGDRVLVRAARVIAEELGNLGTIYRTNGTEFAVITAGAPTSDIKTQALALIARFEAANFGSPEQPIHLTLSGGVAKADPGVPMNIAFAAADTALESAKAAGRSRIVFASDQPAIGGIIESDDIVWNTDAARTAKGRRSRAI